MMKDVINFKVHGYNPHLSDHCKISVKIQSRFTFHEQQQLRAAPQNIKWSEAQENKFLRNLDNDRIKMICSEIDKVEQNHSSEKEFQILFSEYSDMLHKAAFGINPPSNKKRRKEKLGSLGIILIVEQNIDILNIFHGNYHHNHGIKS